MGEIKRMFSAIHGGSLDEPARDDGEDGAGNAALAQETFMRAWQSLPSIRHVERFLPWLFRIATNIARSHLRHARRICWLPWQDRDVPYTAPTWIAT